MRIDEDIYKLRIALYQASLIGRVTQNKGDSPWKLVDLKVRLQELWKPSDAWRFISLRRGYYNTYFSNPSDRNRIWEVGSWSLKPGLIRLHH